MSAREELRNYVENGAPFASFTDGERLAFRFLCERIDELREQRDKDVLDFAERMSRLETQVANFARVLTPSQMELIRERVVGYDQRFVEVHQRLDEWQKIKDRLNNTLEQFERVMKGGLI